jgi:hypothetical protein
MAGFLVTVATVSRGTVISSVEIALTDRARFHALSAGLA